MMTNSTSMQGMGQIQLPGRDQAFKSIDSNSDGSFDRGELTKMGEKFSSDTGMEFSLDEIMDQFDSDGNGALSEEEGFALLDKLKEMAGGSPPPSGQRGPVGVEDQYRANAKLSGHSQSLLEILA